jgi:putative ABC transport system permease protein
MSAKRPPRLAEWLLQMLRRSPDAPYLAGDLAEGFAKRAATNARAARRWYWAQVLRSLRHRLATTPSVAARAARSRAWSRRGTPLLHDVAMAGRTLRRRPASSIVAALTVALGVTSTATLFTLTYSVLFRPLPWQESERLVRVWEERRGGTPLDLWLTNLTFEAWRASPSTVTAIEGYRDQSYVVAGPDGAMQVAGAAVTPGLIALLGGTPSAGRLFVEGDVDAVLVSDRFRDRLFGMGTDVIGRPLTFEGRGYSIVGVLPTSIAFPSPGTDLWVPLAVGTTRLGSFNIAMTMKVIARLASGATPAQAAAEAQSRANAVPPADPAQQTMIFGSDGQIEVHAVPLLEFATQESRPALLALLAGVALLLLTAVASLAGLQLARTVDRRRELAIRSAIGAARGRLATQLLAEAAWISAAGGVVAAIATRWALDATPAFLPPGFPRIETLAFDGVTLGAVVVLTAGAGLVMGLLPAWHIAHARLTLADAEDDRSVVAFGAGTFLGRARGLLIAGQVAVAVVLLVSAGLVAKTLVALVTEDLGYEPGNLLVARVVGVRADRNSRLAPDAMRKVIERLDAVPGVTGVALATALPFQHASGRMALGFRLPGPDGQDVPASATQATVTPSYFELLGLRLVEGRFLQSSDLGRDDRAGELCVVNETFASAYLKEPRLGPFPLGGEIVGIVEDVRDRGLREPVDPQLFCLYDTASRHPSSQAARALAGQTRLLVRISRDPLTLAPTARAIVRDVDGRLGLDEITTMGERLAAMVTRPRLIALLAGIFAGFALLVASIGLFGALSYTVSRRTREIGVRTALGATPGRAARTVVRQGMTVAVAGTLAGLGAAALAARVMTSLLYEVTPYDPTVFVAAPATMMAVAALACYLPARRAARVDPVTALRSN